MLAAMSTLPRRLYLPRPDRAYWRATATTKHGLQYLAWGERRFGDSPMPCSRHDGWVFAVLEAGSPLVVTQVGTSRFDAGTALIMGPDHAYGWADTKRLPCRMLLWMYRNPQTALLANEDSASRLEIRLSPPVLKRVQLIHAMCRDESQRAGRTADTALDALQRLLEATLMAEVDARGSKGEDAAILQSGLQWIAAHLDTAQPAARLADYLGISVSTLFRKFKSELGESTHDYFLRMRMEAARRKFAEGTSVKEAAFQLGYRHAGDLSRAYHRHFDSSPTASGRRGEHPETWRPV